VAEPSPAAALRDVAAGGTPVISLVYGLTGFDIERIEGSGTAGTSAVVVPVAAQAVAARAVADSESGGVHA